MKQHRMMIGLVAASVALAGCQNERINVAVSRATAEQWVKDVLPGYRLVGFSSATLDTDDDGYVTADITVTKDGKTLRLIQLSAPAHGKMLEWQKGDSAKLHQVPFQSEF
jgi:hypothetical protein